MRIATLLLCSLLVACNGKNKDKPSVSGDADTDSDSDSDTDADTDADADTDQQFEDNLLLDCDETYDTPAPSDCVTDVINCGEVVYGDNAGGSTHYECGNNDVFEQCSGSAGGSDCDGPERVYTLQAPVGVTHFIARLVSCEDSWLFYHQSNNACPDPESGTPSGCSYAVNGTFNDQESIYQFINPSADRQITFVVEGYKNDGGNFALYVECFEDET